MNRKKIRTDINTAAPYPTAISSEFVPLTAEDTETPVLSSENLFDFIPAPKEKKYGK